MVDIKKVKAALLKEFSGQEPPPPKVTEDDPLDTVLSQYFNGAAHMPPELTLEAITNLLRLDHHDREASRRKVKHILDQHDPSWSRPTGPVSQKPEPSRHI